MAPNTTQNPSHVFTSLIGRGWSFPPEIGAQGGIALTNERSELRQSVEIILSTSPGQRVMRPTFGCRLQELVFAPNNSPIRRKKGKYADNVADIFNYFPYYIFEASLN